LHLVDALVTRAAALLVPLLVGLAPEAVALYLVFVSFHAVFIHANLRLRLRWLEPVLVTPRIHHFHHAAESEAIDCNFAVHLPVIDRLFGTRFLPVERWPRAYGVVGQALPPGWLGQIWRPSDTGDTGRRGAGLRGRIAQWRPSPSSTSMAALRCFPDWRRQGCPAIAWSGAIRSRSGPRRRVCRTTTGTGCVRRTWPAG